MHLTHLSLKNFRNYVRLELELSPGVVVIVGNNAQGKSNLLEAIYFLATAKSFRASNDRELINWLAADTDTPFAYLLAKVEKEHANLRIEIAIKEEARKENGANGATMPAVSKRIRTNNVARRAIDLIGLANVVMFSPQDIDLIQGAPQMRRRYLDVTISQVDPRYCRSLAHYNKVLIQRNHLLRQIREKHARPDQLLFWDQELVSAGAYVILQRLVTVSALNELTFGIHRGLTGSQERFHTVCRLNLDVAAGANLAETLHGELARATPEARIGAIAEVFKRKLAQFQPREIAYGMSLLGPHRDDLAFVVDDREVSLYGSRGQQRTVALSLKMAEAEFMRSRTGEEPILLLDDVTSELDAERRSYVLESIKERQQVLVTTSDLHAFDADFLAKSLLLRVENGAIEPVNLATLS